MASSLPIPQWPTLQSSCSHIHPPLGLLSQKRDAHYPFQALDLSFSYNDYPTQTRDQALWCWRQHRRRSTSQQDIKQDSQVLDSISPIAQPYPPFGEAPAEQNPAQQCKMIVFYFLKSSSFLEMPPSENIMMRKLCRFKIIKVEDQALCKASGEDQDSKSHSPSTLTTSLCPRLVSDSNPQQSLKLLLPKVVGETGSRSSGDAWSPCFVQKAKTQDVAYPNSGTSSTLWKRILHLQ